MSNSKPLKPVAIEARAYRVPIADPLVVSFGIMRDRPCVLVRVVDADGSEGWDGRVAVPQGPGLGFSPDLAALERYRTWPAP